MSGRDRSAGWEHAKKSGHAYEKSLAAEINNHEHPKLIAILESKTKRKFVNANAEYGTARVLSILDDRTTSKADIVVEFESKFRIIKWIESKLKLEPKKLGISVKKSVKGQVWITSLDRFEKGCKHYGIKISPLAHWSLCCLTGETGGVPIESFADKVVLTKLHTTGQFLERRDNRLIAKTIADFYPDAWEELVNFFQTNYPKLTMLAFGRGVVSENVGWAEIVYYKNGSIFKIDDLRKLKNTNKIDQNSKSRSTIWLPFGFLQVHRPTPSGQTKSGPFQLQFHHVLDQIMENREV